MNPVFESAEPRPPDGPPVQRRARPAVSVVVCAFTMRRWDDVLAAVASVRPQLAAGDQVVVVVDHHDQLRVALAAELAGAEDVRVLPSSGPPGLSGARNTGVQAAGTDIVLFLDDDATAEPGLVSAMVDAMEHEPVAGVGGAPVAAWPTGRRPWWFPPEFDWVVGCAYVGLPTERAEVRNVIGAVMAFRRDVLDRVGPFTTGVGRVGARPAGGEETELCIRVREQLPEALIYHLPDARVRHRVTADRTTWRYFLRRCYHEGLSKAQVSRLVGAGHALASERRYVRRVLPRALGRHVLDVLRGRLPVAGMAVAVCLGLAVTSAGYLRGMTNRTAHSGPTKRTAGPSPTGPTNRTADPSPTGSTNRATDTGPSGPSGAGPGRIRPPAPAWGPRQGPG